MITVVAKQNVKSEEIAKFIEAAKELVKETNKSDVGCIHYDLFQDANNPQTFTFIEGWENQDVLDKHMASVHFKEIFPRLQSLCIGDAEITIYNKI